MHQNNSVGNRYFKNKDFMGGLKTEYFLINRKYNLMGGYYFEHTCGVLYKNGENAESSTDDV